MKRFLTVSILIVCLGQISCHNKKSVKNVTLDFACFKHPYTSFIIDFDSKTLTCKNFGYEQKLNEKTNEPIAVYENDYELNSKATDELKEIFSKYAPDTTTRRAEEDVVDGGGFRISYVHSPKDTVRLTVINPSRNDKYKTDFQQIDKFFEIAYTVVTDSMGINTLDESNEVYFSGLPIRKVAENPLTYKIWGNFSGCREDNKELVDFFNSLSKEECVLVDIGERKLSYCLTEIIAECSLKRNIHFIRGEDLPWLWGILKDLRKQVLDAKKQNKVLSYNISLLDVYLKDSAVFNKWLDIPENELFKTKEELIQNCH